jgi:predicted permease
MIRSPVSTLDFRLGLRMLVKYPALSAIAVIGMAVAIAVGAGFFGFFASLFDSTLPLDDSDRVIAIHYNLGDYGNQQREADFIAWRGALKSVQDLAAFTDDRRTLIVPGEPVELIDIARMTASGFRVARTPPLLGRPLLDADEQPGAPPVLVIAHDEWQRRFGGDSAVIGREVRLGAEVHTIVGVMPDGFYFPVNHRYWAALRIPPNVTPGEGSSVFVFGRLANGATLAQAQTELAVVRNRMLDAYPEIYRRLRPEILSYAHRVAGVDSDEAIMWTVLQTFISLLLVVVAVNVAVLVYARTASRAGEIAVRTALGASRARIVIQLFAEAFVLSGIAAVLGLTVAAVALRRTEEVFGGDLPYWTTFALSPALVLYVVALAIIGAVVVGVLPALQATGRQVHAGLQRLSSHGSRMEVGPTWTMMIVAQVAVAVAVLPFTVDFASRTLATGVSKPQYPIEQFLRTSLSLEREEMTPTTDSAAFRRAREERLRARGAELLRRLETEPAVAGVAFASHFGEGGGSARVEVDDGRRTAADTARDRAAPGGGYYVWSNRVAANFFTVLGVPILAGRGFTATDALEGSTAVIVDQAFADQLLGGGNAIGRRVRHLRWTSDAPDAEIERGPWMEIVGLVANVMTGGEDLPSPGLYRPTTLEQLPAPVSLAIRVRGAPPATYAARLREIAAAVDPTLQLIGVRPAADAEHERQRGMQLMGLGTAIAALSVVLLSAAGIYAMMSFTVVRRRREIGIRSALGANPRRILTTIFARASAQLGAGLLIGLLGAFALNRALGPDGMGERGAVVLPVVVAIIVVVGLLAALGPARRGLSIQPAEALREE